MSEPIRTERLVLREAEARDRAAFVELLASDEVGTYVGGPQSPEDLDRLPGVPGRRPGVFVVEHDGAMIGTVTLERRDLGPPGRVRPEHGEADLGYLFLPRAWGNGFAAEACAAALGRFAAAHPGEPVVLCTQTANERSMRLAAKLGFVEVQRYEKWDAEQWFGIWLPGTADFSGHVRGAFRRGDNDLVVRMSRSTIERGGDPALEVEARYSLARVAIRGGDLALGADRAREALDVAVRAGDRRLEERPRHVLAAVARMSGDFAGARELYRASIALNEELGQPAIVNSELHNLAFCELKLGNVDTARELFATSRERVFAHGWDDFVPYVCLAGAALAVADKDHLLGALLIGVTDAAFAALGQIPDPDDAADLAELRDAVIAALGAGRFEERYAEGRAADPRAVFA